MENPKRLDRLQDRGMSDELLYQLIKTYFKKNPVLWYPFDLDTVLPVPPSGKEIEVKVNNIDTPDKMTIELIEVDYPNNHDPSDNIDYGRLTSKLLKQVKEELEQFDSDDSHIKGITLTIGQIGSKDKFLLLELYIKNKPSGPIKIVRPPHHSIVTDNLTPTSIPPGKKRINR